MNVILFGATGMVGSGVLRECLLDPTVGSVLSMGRRASGATHPRLLELVRPDLFDRWDASAELTAYDTCFFCLGASSAGMSEADYTRVTYDLTVAVARTLAEQNPVMTFCYVSGLGTDSTERGRIMWARVKGKTENQLLRMPFKAAYMFRPGFIQPLHGARSRTRWVQASYDVVAPLQPLIRRLAPRYVTTTENVGRALLEAAERGSRERVLGNRAINELAAARLARTRPQASG